MDLADIAVHVGFGLGTFGFGYACGYMLLVIRKFFEQV